MAKTRFGRVVMSVIKLFWKGLKTCGGLSLRQRRQYFSCWNGTQREWDFCNHCVCVLANEDTFDVTSHSLESMPPAMKINYQKWMTHFLRLKIVVNDTWPDSPSRCAALVLSIRVVARQEDEIWTKQRNYSSSRVATHENMQMSFGFEFASVFYANECSRRIEYCHRS